jgi:hypothetical protein
MCRAIFAKKKPTDAQRVALLQYSLTTERRRPVMKTDAVLTMDEYLKAWRVAPM